VRVLPRFTLASTVTLVSVLSGLVFVCFGPCRCFFVLIALPYIVGLYRVIPKIPLALPDVNHVSPRHADPLLLRLRREAGPFSLPLGNPLKF